MSRGGPESRARLLPPRATAGPAPLRAARRVWGVVRGRMGGGGVESEAERGAAVIEFVLVFLVLVVPLV
ncbi:MAG TPA: hypothetical protein VFA45_02185, partial [Actinomycetes bacterium]|nr:hypothetical protein [Actinomycetes bacterium]